MKSYHDYEENASLVLEDYSATGRKRPWKERKLLAEDVSMSYDRIGESVGVAENGVLNWAQKKSLRIADCGSLLQFVRLHNERLKLKRANFCKVRLCPMCSWRRSLKIFGQVQAVVSEVLKERKYGFLFLTLTVKNCSADKLSDTITMLLEAYHKLINRKCVKQTVKGTFRALEVTYNKTDGTFHPHIHAVLLVSRRYFAADYINHDSWCELWRDCLSVDYVPIVDVRRIKGEDLTVGKAVAEVAKYAVKDGEYIKDDLDDMDRLVTILDSALAGRRLVDFTGKFREVKRKLALDDAIDGDLVNVGGLDVVGVSEEQLVTYVWYRGFMDYLKR